SALEPQLATLVDRPPSGDHWIYEIKFDGYRMLAAVADGKVALRSRNGLDWTGTLPSIAAALGKLKIKSAVIDGELCYIDDRGLSVFQKLQNALPRGLGKPADTQRLYFYVFDLLFQDGIDVRDEPLLDRKHRLRLALGKRPPAALRYSDHLQSDGHTALLHACSAGLEGLIAKRADAGYRSGRGKDWLKLKCQKRQEFVIVGMIRATGTRQGFRSLVLGTRDGKTLKYAGRVGTGFSQQSLKTLAALLAKRVVERPALSEHPRLPGVVWVKPDLVCEVEYTEITAEGSLRHPSFQGLREDKPARQVKLEKAVPVSRVEADDAAAAQAGDNAVGGVAISSPERIMDAASGTTKLQIARYHEAVAPWFMPYAGNRPLALVRCPQGDAQQCFFQKHRMRGVGPHVQSARVGSHEVIHVEDTTGVLELVQFNVIEFHGWGASMADPHRPDWLVIDLDPDSALGFGDVVDAALEIREALAAAGLKSWVKTTGGKGLHVCVPLEPANDWATVKSFSQALAQALAAQNPKRYVATMSKAKRKGKIFIDYLRNGEGATAVLPYSPRSRPGMTVAMPVAWKDIRHLDPRDFTIASVPQRLKRRRSDPWKDFLDQPQTLPV
ncbi:MAG TPA: DNA ligase D, partial [Fontimonas sp.]